MEFLSVKTKNAKKAYSICDEACLRLGDLRGAVQLNQMKLDPAVMKGEKCS